MLLVKFPFEASTSPEIMDRIKLIIVFRKIKRKLVHLCQASINNAENCNLYTVMNREYYCLAVRENGLIKFSPDIGIPEE